MWLEMLVGDVLQLHSYIEWGVALATFGRLMWVSA